MQGSFWDMFDVPSASGHSGVDDVLKRMDESTSNEPVTVEELLVCEDLIQECKYGNERVQKFFSNKDNILKLIHYVVTIPPPNAATTSSSSTTTTTTTTTTTDSTTDTPSTSSTLTDSASTTTDSTATTTTTDSSTTSSASASSSSNDDDSDSDASSTNTSPDESKEDESDVEHVDEEEEDKSNTYPYLASEVLTALPPETLELSFREADTFDLLFSLLDTPHLDDPSHVAYFRKVVVAAMERNTAEFMAYVQSHDVMDRLLRHIGIYSIVDIVIMIAWDEAWGRPAIPTEWLSSLQLTRKLVEKLAPEHADELDVHRNATRMLVDMVIKTPATSPSPLIDDLLSSATLHQVFEYMFATPTCDSSLNGGLSVLTVLVKRHAELGAPADDTAASSDASVSASTSTSSPSNLPQPFAALVPYLPKIFDLLTRELPDVAVQFGRAQPFGETRIKVVELTLMLLRAAVPAVDAELIRLGVFSKLLDCMFAFPWNNMLHGLVESTFNVVWNGTNAALRDAYVHDADLIGRIMSAYETNEKSQAAASRPARLGYMGHLLRMSGTIEERRNSEPEELNRILRDKSAIWLTFVDEKLEKDIAKFSSTFGADATLGFTNDLVDDDDDDDGTMLQYVRDMNQNRRSSYDFEQASSWTMPDDDDFSAAVACDSHSHSSGSSDRSAIDSFVAAAAASSSGDWFATDGSGSSAATAPAAAVAAAATFDDDFDAPASSSSPIMSETTGASSSVDDFGTTEWPSVDTSSKASTAAASKADGFGDEWADFGAAGSNGSESSSESNSNSNSNSSSNSSSSSIDAAKEKSSEEGDSSSSTAPKAEAQAWASFDDADF